jgi:outer membrane protein TolC
MPLINQLANSLPTGSVPLAFSNWLYGFNLSWELDLWGRLRRNIESSNASLDGSVEDYDAALVTLFADVATNYVQYRVAQQRIKIARDNVRIQEGVLALAEEKFRVGTTTKLDVEQARTVLEQTRSTIPGQQILLGQANDTLCILVGVPPRDLEADLGPGPALGSSPIPNTPAWVADGQTSAVPSARWPHNRRRSALPRPTSTQPSSSTAPSAGTQKTSRKHSPRGAFWACSRRGFVGTS